MIVRQPQLLLYATSTLQAHLVGLRDVLRVSYELVLTLVDKHPNLLCFSTATLQVRMHGQCAGAKGGVSWWWRCMSCFGTLGVACTVHAGEWACL